MSVSVAIVDDDTIFSEGVRVLLEKSGRFECVATCASGDEAIQRLPAKQPRVVLMDIQMPGRSGPECVVELTKRLPKTEILMLTVFEEYDQIYQALVAGATGYLLKRTAPVELLNAIDELVNGGSPMSGAIARKVVLAFRQLGHSSVEPTALSQREEEILRALARGRRPKEIAQDTGLSFHTIRTHQQNIYKKLQVGSRREAIKYVKLGPANTPAG